MTPVDLTEILRRRDLGLDVVGAWLDAEMPNPVLPEEQRWTVKTWSNVWYIDFAAAEDAMLFTLRWS